MARPLTARRDAALAAIARSDVLDLLAPFTPRVVSTILVGLDTEDSDIDILCCYSDANGYAAWIDERLQHFERFISRLYDDHVIASFLTEGFQFEVYAAPIPVEEQMGWRHFQVMERLVGLGGGSLRGAVRRRKRRGVKTEPAIAQLLQLDGDPFQAVLDLHNWSDRRILDALSRAGSANERTRK